MASVSNRFNQFEYQLSLCNFEEVIVSRVYRSLLFFAFALAMFATNQMAEGCTIAVVSGSVTQDGRPLLWKNRDITNSNYDRQEVRYFNDGSHGGYLCLVTTGHNDETTSYFGINDAGFAIMNSLSPDLVTGYPSLNGIFMKLALQECGSINDFQNLLVATAGSRGHIWANFGVIDKFGNAAMFEADDNDYRRYNADAAGQGGVVVRANNSIWGAGELGSRFERATMLFDDAIANDELNFQHLIQYIAKDLGETPAMPCGQWPTVEPAINRYTTRSSVVVHGVLPSEDPRLSTFWCTLGEPSCGISTPMWSSSGIPSELFFNSGEQTILCAATKEKELYCYSSLATDSTIDTEALVGSNGFSGIQAYSLPIENDAFEAVASRLEYWRSSNPSNLEINQFQNEISSRSYHYYQLETAPTTPSLTSVSDVSINPGHEKVTITWTDPPADNNPIEIWRSRWNDQTGASVYPDYQNHAMGMYPSRPENRNGAQTDNQWELLGVIDPGIESFTDDITDRGVYCYELFSIDAGFNSSAILPESLSATNYWLGDVSDGIYGQADGVVDVTDMSPLGSSFGRFNTEPGFLDQCDVGPTISGSPYAIPEPDGQINFEDLMIFSMNMGMTSPAKIDFPAAETVALAWQQLESGQWALQLSIACPSLKGLRLSSSQQIILNESELSGNLISLQNAPVFIRNISTHGIDINLAVMRNSIGFQGAGELVRFPAELQPDKVTIQARDVNNQSLVVRLNGSGSADVTSDILTLHGNFPNPFNPQTIIQYNLPVSTDVVLEICSLSGRKVATLVSEKQLAGQQNIMWDGCNQAGIPVASGVYFYTIRAAEEHRSGRMCLIR